MGKYFKGVVPEGYKYCSGCKQILSTSEFGLGHYCLKCHKETQRQYRKIKPEQYLEHERRYKENHLPLNKIYHLTRYLIPLASNCLFCGSTKNLERHHPDYDKPLEVITMCRRCHKKIHILFHPKGPRNPPPPLEKNCKTCGEIFISKQSKQYCSIKCRLSYRHSKRIFK